jgi:hypothetical protein
MPNVAGFAGDQTSRCAIGMVSELVRGLEHALAGRRPQQVRLRQRAGHRGDRDAGASRYIVDRLGHEIATKNISRRV